MWHEPASTLPREEGEQIDWLFDRWRVPDDWVEDARLRNADAPD